MTETPMYRDSRYVKADCMSYSEYDTSEVADARVNKIPRPIQ
jgi:hypothetical protein